MFNKFIEGTAALLMAVSVIALSVAILGEDQNSTAHVYMQPDHNAQVHTLSIPAADYSSAPAGYAVSEYIEAPVQYIEFPPLHINVNTGLNN